MKCPFRKEITVETSGTDVNNIKKTTRVEFADCYERKCPFWNAYHLKCAQASKL